MYNSVQQFPERLQSISFTVRVIFWCHHNIKWTVIVKFQLHLFFLVPRQLYFKVQKEDLWSDRKELKGNIEVMWRNTNIVVNASCITLYCISYIERKWLFALNSDWLTHKISPFPAIKPAWHREGSWNLVSKGKDSQNCLMCNIRLLLILCMQPNDERNVYDFIPFLQSSIIVRNYT